MGNTTISFRIWLLRSSMYVPVIPVLPQKRHVKQKKRHFETAPNEYSWTNLYLMSILSLLKKGSLLAEEQASRELCWFCPEGHFPKLNFILKLNVNEFNGWAHCRSLGAMQSWYQ